MPSYLTSIVLEWSADGLDDASPTYTTVSNDEIRNIEWWVGIDREGSSPEPGGMTVTLKNRNRKWEPLFGSNLIDTQQRFRLTLNGTQEGVWYTENFELDYPQGGEFSWVTITCGDGFTVLAQDDLPGLDPPDANSYADVVAFDEPWGYWRLGESAGTMLVAHLRYSVHWHGKKKKRRKHRHPHRFFTRETTAEVGGVAGGSGTYKNTPTLGEPGVILGDLDTCVYFSSASDEHAVIALDTSDTIATNRLSAEAWVKQDTAGSMGILDGPYLGAADGRNTWRLQVTGTSVVFAIADSGGAGFISATGATAISTDVWYHVVGTWDGVSLRVYLNGVLDGTTATAGANTIVFPTTADFVYIGGNPLGTTWNGWLDELAIYEKALPVERMEAHITAATARGYAQQTAGERVVAIADSPLWTAVEVSSGGMDIQPVMQVGQPKLEEIAESAHAEGPQTMFVFGIYGDPAYFGHEWKATAAHYNTPQATFTDDGSGISYNDVRIEYDFETFNEVVASHETGEAVVVTDATAQAQRGRRVRTEETDLLLVNHSDVATLAATVLELYKDPIKRVVTLTIDGHHALAQITVFGIGARIRIKKQGETGDPTDWVANIIGIRKAIDTSKHLTCTYTLSRGFDAGAGYWHLGSGGFSELGSTTVLA